MFFEWGGEVWYLVEHQGLGTCGPRLTHKGVQFGLQVQFTQTTTTRRHHRVQLPKRVLLEPASPPFCLLPKITKHPSPCPSLGHITHTGFCLFGMDHWEVGMVA